MQAALYIMLSESVECGRFSPTLSYSDAFLDAIHLPNKVLLPLVIMVIHSKDCEEVHLPPC